MKTAADMVLLGVKLNIDRLVERSLLRVTI